MTQALKGDQTAHKRRKPRKAGQSISKVYKVTTFSPQDSVRSKIKPRREKRIKDA